MCKLTDRAQHDPVGLTHGAVKPQINKDARYINLDNEDWSDCVDAQPDLSLSWAYMCEGMLSHDAVHFS